jgi:hypothetical protein
MAMNVKQIPYPVSKRYVQAFWDKVSIRSKNECWIWKGAKYNKQGYGMVGIKYIKYLAHRVSYAISVGPVPSDKIVCHKCNNTKCVNPSHLYLGTPKDNSDDQVLKRLTEGVDILIKMKKEESNN